MRINGELVLPPGIRKIPKGTRVATNEGLHGTVIYSVFYRSVQRYRVTVLIDRQPSGGPYRATYFDYNLTILDRVLTLDPIWHAEND